MGDSQTDVKGLENRIAESLQVEERQLSAFRDFGDVEGDEVRGCDEVLFEGW